MAELLTTAKHAKYGKKVSVTHAISFVATSQTISTKNGHIGCLLCVHISTPLHNRSSVHEFAEKQPQCKPDLCASAHGDVEDAAAHAAGY